MDFFYYLINWVSHMMPLLIIALVIYLIWRVSRTVYKFDGYWGQYFQFTFSTQEFYSEVEKKINGQQMPGVRISRTERHETNLLSPSREYLRIEREKDVFEVCAAPFGAGFFVSSRKGTLPGLRQKILATIPFIGGYLVYIFFRKTFYQIDSQNMFNSAVHDIILDIVKNITIEKGGRDLTELERQFQRIGK